MDFRRELNHRYVNIYYSYFRVFSQCLFSVFGIDIKEEYYILILKCGF